MSSEQSQRQSAENKAEFHLCSEFQTMFRILQICGLYYVDDTFQHFSMRVNVHLASDKASHIFKHLREIF